MEARKKLEYMYVFVWCFFAGKLLRNRMSDSYERLSVKLLMDLPHDTAR